MRLLLPLPLIDSGMAKTTQLHYSMCSSLNLDSTFLEWICISKSLQVGVHGVLQFKSRRRWCMLRDDAAVTYDFLDHHHHHHDFLEHGEY
ncbi:hypothetical protein VPH35_059818 [Triticum aestivum]